MQFFKPISSFHPYTTFCSLAGGAGTAIGLYEAKEEGEHRIWQVVRGVFCSAVSSFAGVVSQSLFDWTNWSWLQGDSRLSQIASSLFRGAMHTLVGIGLSVATIQSVRWVVKARWRGAAFNQKVDQIAELLSYAVATGLIVGSGGSSAQILMKQFQEDDWIFLGPVFAAGSGAISLPLLRKVEKILLPEIQLLERELERIAIGMECAQT